jgi:hypothetical protein
MSFLDSSRPRPRSMLWLFYSSAFLSAIMFGVGSYAPVSYYRPARPRSCDGSRRRLFPRALVAFER